MPPARVTGDKPPASPEHVPPVVSLVTSGRRKDHQNLVTPVHQGGRDALLSRSKRRGRAGNGAYLNKQQNIYVTSKNT